MTYFVGSYITDLVEDDGVALEIETLEVTSDGIVSKARDPSVPIWYH
jgi:hypothetical protein